MKHWVIKREDGSLDIIVTSDDIPPDNALAPASADWKPQFLTYDPRTRMIIMDPDKVRSFVPKVVKRKINLRWGKLILAFILGFIVGLIV